MKIHLSEKFRSSQRVKIFIVLAAVVFILLMFPSGESIESDVMVGSVWINEDLVASIPFEILKDSKQYQNELQNAVKRIQPIFLKDRSLERHLLDSLQKANNLLINSISKSTDENIGFPLLSETSLTSFKKFNQRPKNFQNAKVKDLKILLKSVTLIIIKVYQKGFIDQLYKDISKDSIAFREGKFESVFPKENFLDRNTIKDFILLNVQESIGSNSELNEAVEEYLSNFLKPNLIFSRELTETAIQNAKDKVPLNIGIVNENERIVAKNDWITPEIKMKISSYKIAKGQESSFWGNFSQNLGKFLHIQLILVPFIIYIRLFRKKIYADNLKILLISSIILFIGVLTFFVYKFNVSGSTEYLILVPVASMLLTIIFDSRIGFYGTVIISLIVGGLRGNDYAFTAMNIIAGGLAAYTVRDIKNRTQIFRSFFFILLGYILAIIAFGLESFDTIEQMLSGFIFGVSNALISPVLTYGLIIFIEKIFHITTDLTLVELADFNKPALKDLAKNAPGTFNHSVAMGTLAETTAEAIGANPTLARVGALYHDIGKIMDPESFVENQINTNNIHEHISPERSVKLITDHVNKGIELAKSYSLPQEVIDFIPMHHGTMPVSFFYEKAKAKYGEDRVDIDDFRYPGPKPNTKETAIVMLADACESVVRSLSDADTQKIENVINNLIDNRIENGQLDEAPLTFKELKQIRESFLGILIGHQHKRIRYPRQEELENTKIEE